MRRSRARRGMRPLRPVDKREVDVLVVLAASTPGLRRAETALLEGLEELGVVVETAVPDYAPFGRLRVAQPLIDLVEAMAMHRSTTRGLARVNPRALLYPTSLSTIFEPSWRLERAGVRFDATASENRRARRNAIQRWLERRSLRRAKVLLPYSIRSAARVERLVGVASEPVPLPPPVERTSRSPTPGDAIVLAYAGNPEKKGLDLIVGAWERLGPPAGHLLVVAGIDAEDAETWLARRRVRVPSGVTWAGLLDADHYRRLRGRAEVFVAASRFEDHGIAQLEALADGALLVTVPSAGPFEALSLARELAPGLVAAAATAEALAGALDRALRMDDEERRRYRVGAAAMMAAYEPPMFIERLRSGVLPGLLGQGTWSNPREGRAAHSGIGPGSEGPSHG